MRYISGTGMEEEYIECGVRSGLMERYTVFRVVVAVRTLVSRDTRNDNTGSCNMLYSIFKCFPIGLFSLTAKSAAYFKGEVSYEGLR